MKKRIKFFFFYMMVLGFAFEINNLFAASEKNDSTAFLSDRARAGQKIFNEHGVCWACHGHDADGQTRIDPAVALLDPKPTNLRDRTALDYLQDEAVFKVIKFGISGTAMVPSGKTKETILSPPLSDVEISKIIVYLREIRGEKPGLVF